MIKVARSQRAGAGGQGEAGAGAGASGAMAVGAGFGAGFGFGLAATTGFLWAAGGAAPAGCNSTKTGFGTRRGACDSASAPGTREPSAGVTNRTGTVCG